MKRGGLTGDKNIDIVILNKLSDQDLRQACQIDTLTRSICNNDLFWAHRLQTRYPHIKSQEEYTWRDLYFYTQIHQKYGTFLGTIDDIAAAKPKLVTSEQYLVWLDLFFKLLQQEDGSGDIEYTIYNYVPDEYPLFKLISTIHQNINNAHWFVDAIPFFERVNRYYEISSQKIVTFSNQGPEHLFIDTLRLAGSPEEIRNFLIDRGNPVPRINQHIEHAQRLSTTLDAPAYPISEPNGHYKIPDVLFDLAPIEKEISKILTVDKKFSDIVTFIENSTRDLDPDIQAKIIERLKDWTRNYY